MYPSLDDDFVSDLFCFDQSNGAEVDDYTQFGVNLQPDQGDAFAEFGSYDVDLQQEPEEIFSIEAAQLDLVSQEPQQVGQKDYGIVREEEVEIDCGTSGGAVKQEQEHLDDDYSRKRAKTGACSRGGRTKACRERLRREKLNERFMDLSSVLEPGKTLKTDKPAILDDAIRIVNQLRDETHKLEETNQKLLEEIKSLKAEKNELREEKLVLKAGKEKKEQELKAVVVPSSSSSRFMSATFEHNKMAVYPSCGYIPMWHYMPQSVHDTSRDQELRPPAA